MATGLAGGRPAAPKYALFERERRWRVDPARLPDLAGVESVLIEDRYLNATQLRLRRVTDSATQAVARKLTKKYATADVRARPIVTIYLDAVEYDAFAVLPAAVLVKRRFQVPTAHGIFSVDCFAGPLAGLVLAEREMADAEQLDSVVPPDWALADVTDDPNFAGGALAFAGLLETQT